MPRSIQSIRIILVTIIVSAAAMKARAHDVRYWAWQRDEPLTEEEVTELNGQKIKTIYWQVGELENVGEAWQWKARFRFPSSNAVGIRFVPVVRLVSHERQPFSEASLSALLASLSSISARHDELQLDYDAPDRLLGDYGSALKRIHTLVPRLTITALPRWSRADFLKLLEPNVDELLPMLYDFEAEPILKNQSPLPLIEPAKISKLLESWRTCRKPWRAGLPVFARLSVYDSKQKLRGQIRNWNWEELSLNRNLAIVNGGQFGASILRATGTTSIANTPIHQNEEVVVREVDRAVLQSAINAAAGAGAQSVVFFRLPDASASSGWSLHQLRNLEAKPRLVLRKSDAAETLELRNAGDGDLAPRFANNDNNTGGYALEIETGSPIFREAQPGDFASVVAYARDRPATIPFATTLRFRFDQLRAGETLQTGLIQLAPGANFRQTRYRILNIEGGPTWKSLE